MERMWNIESGSSDLCLLVQLFRRTIDNCPIAIPPTIRKLHLNIKLNTRYVPVMRGCWSIPSRWELGLISYISSCNLMSTSQSVYERTNVRLDPEKGLSMFNLSSTPLYHPSEKQGQTKSTLSSFQDPWRALHSYKPSETEPSNQRLRTWCHCTRFQKRMQSANHKLLLTHD